MEDLIIGAYSDEAKARRICKYLLRQFPMAEHGKLEVREKNKDDWNLYSKWLLSFPGGKENWSRYTKTLDHMRTAMSDFENGYQQALKDEQEKLINNLLLTKEEREMRKIDAIRSYRRRMNCDLLTAKQVYEKEMEDGKSTK